MLKDLRALGKETLAYGLSTVVARLLNFLLLPLYTNYLAPGEYGIVATVFAYIAFLNFVFQYGMDQAYMRFASDKEGRGPEACFTAATASLAGTTGVLAALLVLAAEPLARFGGLRAGDADLVRYSAGILALDALSVVPFAELRLSHRIWAFVGIRSFNIALNIALNILFVATMGLGARGVLAASLTASAASLILLAPVFALRIRAAFDAALWREMAGYGLPFVPAGIGAMIVQVIDRPILLRLTDEATVGVYQANYRLGVLLSVIVVMFDQAWRPFFLERAGRKDAPRLFALVLTYFTAATSWAALALSMFLPDIVRFPVGGMTLIHRDYWGGLGIIPVVLLGYLFHGIYVNLIAGAMIAKRSGVLAQVTLLGGAVNIAGNFLLIPRLGMIGAAYAAAAAHLTTVVAMYFGGRALYPIPYELSRLARLAAVFALCAAAAAFGEPLTAGQPARALAGRLLLLLAMPALWLACGAVSMGELEGLREAAKNSRV